ncbi:MAG TPA: HAD family hydrolase [Anaerolineae bacterium]|nr:HAD family hydrolase [Anaerolineae bacterium]
MITFDTIAFDADDTLWHSESLYAAAQEEYRHLFAPYAEAEKVDRVLHQTEMRNLTIYGYGVKGFALSMIEAALELSQRQITGHEVQRVLDLAKQMLRTDVELIEGVADVVAQLAQTYPLILITKGDLAHQEAKIEQSGLKAYFRSIEIVSDKTPQSYAALLARHHIEPLRFLMIGNSLRSDVLPVLEIGGQAVHVPYAITWAHEQVDVPSDQQGRYHELEHIGQLPTLVEQLTR